MPDYKAIGLEIERRLDRIPRKPVRVDADLTDRDVHAPLPALSDLLAPGSFGCRSCGVVVERPGVCSECGSKLARRDAHAEMSSALGSIPAAYAETSLPDLLRSVCHLNDGRDPWTVAGELAADLATGEAATALITGPESGAGKSSLGCAILRRVVALALEALVSWRPGFLGSRLAPIPAEPRVVSLGRGARVVHELALISDFSLGPEASPGAYALAERAPLLVLDGIGGTRGRNVEATTRLLEERWKRWRPTVVTSPLSTHRIGEFYDGSVQRRLCDDRAARVVRVL